MLPALTDLLAQIPALPGEIDLLPGGVVDRLRQRRWASTQQQHSTRQLVCDFHTVAECLNQKYFTKFNLDESVFCQRHLCLNQKTAELYRTLSYSYQPDEVTDTIHTLDTLTFIRTIKEQHEPFFKVLLHLGSNHTARAISRAWKLALGYPEPDEKEAVLRWKLADGPKPTWLTKRITTPPPAPDLAQCLGQIGLKSDDLAVLARLAVKYLTEQKVPPASVSQNTVDKLGALAPLLAELLNLLSQADAPQPPPPPPPQPRPETRKVPREVPPTPEPVAAAPPEAKVEAKVEAEAAPPEAKVEAEAAPPEAKVEAEAAPPEAKVEPETAEYTLPLVDNGVEYQPLAIEYEDLPAEDLAPQTFVSRRPPMPDWLDEAGRAAFQRAWDSVDANDKAEAEAPFLAAQAEAEAYAAAQAAAGDQFLVDDICCSSDRPKQVGIIGFQEDGRCVAMDLWRPFAMAAFAPPGHGKGWLIGAAVENAVMAIAGINDLTAAQCAIILHYHPSSAFRSEMLDAVYPAFSPDQVDLLEQYGMAPQGIDDIVVLAPADQVPRLREVTPHVQVHGIKTCCDELGAEGLRQLFGIDDKNSPMYGREIGKFLRELHTRYKTVKLRDLRTLIETYDFPTSVRDLALRRLDLGAQWLDDNRRLRPFLKPGRVIIIEQCSDWVAEDEAMMLFALIVEALVMRNGQDGEQRVPLLLCYDETHLFSKWPGMVRQMERIFRQRRHLLTSVIVVSQDPQSVPAVLLPLLDVAALGQCQNPETLAYLTKKLAPFGNVTLEETSQQQPGEFRIYSRKWCQVTERLPPPAEGESMLEEEIQPETPEEIAAREAQEKAEAELAEAEAWPYDMIDGKPVLREGFSVNGQRIQPTIDNPAQAQQNEANQNNGENETENEEEGLFLTSESIVLMTVRPRVSQHGGATLTADGDGDEGEGSPH